MALLEKNRQEKMRNYFALFRFFYRAPHFVDVDNYIHVEYFLLLL